FLTLSSGFVPLSRAALRLSETNTMGSYTTPPTPRPLRLVGGRGLSARDPRPAVTATADNPGAGTAIRSRSGHIPPCRLPSTAFASVVQTLPLPPSSGSPCHGGHRGW